MIVLRSNNPVDQGESGRLLGYVDRTDGRLDTLEPGSQRPDGAAQDGNRNEGLAFAGWELPNATALEISAAELEAAGFDIVRSTAAECEQRWSRESISTI